jgi:putative nucleotidyltransferase with HDIG domain
VNLDIIDGELNGEEIYCLSETLRLKGFLGLLSNRAPFKYAFFIALGLGILMDYLYGERTLAGIYIIIVILMAFAYWSIWFQVIGTMSITLIRYTFTSISFPDFSVIALTWFSYLALTITLSTIMKNYLITKTNLLNLTTAMANALDSRDKNTAHHSANVAAYSVLIAREMGLSRKECEDVHIGGLLHDVGKIGVPEAILKKTGRLDFEEFQQIKKHPIIGYKILEHISIFRKNGVLDMVKHHHERYDGNGYPDGLKGKDIPKLARIMAVADAFDAMTARRVYREANDLEFAINEISKNKGTQFDPEIAEIFLKMVEREGTNILPNELKIKIDKIHN